MVEDVCGNILGLDVSVMFKFKSGNTENSQIAAKELVLSDFVFSPRIITVNHFY